MTKLYKDLNDQQKAGFDRQMARLGLKPTDLSFEGVLDTGVKRGLEAAGPFHLSADTALSHISPITLPVTSMAHLNSMVGVPDEHYEQHGYSDRMIEYPPEMPARRQALASSVRNVCDLEYQLTGDERDTLRQAAHAYLQGNSAKVKSYEALLDALHMPGNLTVFAGEAVVVKAGTVLVLGDPKNPDTITKYNFTSITVEKGGQIQIVSPVDLSTQIFISQ